MAKKNNDNVEPTEAPKPVIHSDVVGSPAKGEDFSDNVVSTGATPKEPEVKKDTNLTPIAKEDLPTDAELTSRRKNKVARGLRAGTTAFGVTATRPEKVKKTETRAAIADLARSQKKGKALAGSEPGGYLHRAVELAKDAQTRADATMRFTETVNPITKATERNYHHMGTPVEGRTPGDAREITPESVYGSIHATMAQIERGAGPLDEHGLPTRFNLDDLKHVATGLPGNRFEDVVDMVHATMSKRAKAMNLSPVDVSKYHSFEHPETKEILPMTHPDAPKDPMGAKTKFRTFQAPRNGRATVRSSFVGWGPHKNKEGVLVFSGRPDKGREMSAVLRDRAQSTTIPTKKDIRDGKRAEAGVSVPTGMKLTGTQRAVGASIDPSTGKVSTQWEHMLARKLPEAPAFFRYGVRRDGTTTEVPYDAKAGITINTPEKAEEPASDAVAEPVSSREETHPASARLLAEIAASTPKTTALKQYLTPEQGGPETPTSSESQDLRPKLDPPPVPTGSPLSFKQEKVDPELEKGFVGPIGSAEKLHERAQNKAYSSGQFATYLGSFPSTKPEDPKFTDSSLGSTAATPQSVGDFQERANEGYLAQVARGEEIDRRVADAPAKLERMKAGMAAEAAKKASDARNRGAEATHVVEASQEIKAAQAAERAKPGYVEPETQYMNDPVPESPALTKWQAPRGDPMAVPPGHSSGTQWLLYRDHPEIGAKIDSRSGKSVSRLQSDAQKGSYKLSEPKYTSIGDNSGDDPSPNEIALDEVVGDALDKHHNSKSRLRLKDKKEREEAED